MIYFSLIHLVTSSCLPLDYLAIKDTVHCTHAACLRFCRDMSVSITSHKIIGHVRLAYRQKPSSCGEVPLQLRLWLAYSKYKPQIGAAVIWMIHCSEVCESPLFFPLEGLNCPLEHIEIIQSRRSPGSAVTLTHSQPLSFNHCNPASVKPYHSFVLYIRLSAIRRVTQKRMRVTHQDQIFSSSLKSR